MEIGKILFTEINLLITVKLEIERNCKCLMATLKEVNWTPLIKLVLDELKYIILFVELGRETCLNIFLLIIRIYNKCIE